MAFLLTAPFWAVLLRWLGGPSDATTVPVTMMGAHMQMTERAPRQPGDAARAANIVVAARRVTARYADVKIAERDGYRLFHAEPVGSIEHYVNVRANNAEKVGIEPDHPGSLLYRHDSERETIVGVMYGAPSTANATQLDARAPLSIATWHRHVDFCIAERPNDVSDPRFGFSGTLRDSHACASAGGYFVPVAFGWMTHVYPNSPDRRAIWGGQEMQPAGMQPMPGMR